MNSNQEQTAYFPFGFHISRDAWEKYQVGELLASAGGVSEKPAFVIRHLAQRMNAKRDFSVSNLEPVRAGQIMLAGLLKDILRYMADRYCFEQNPMVIENGLTWLSRQEGTSIVDQPVRMFAHLFPPQNVYENQQTEEEFIRGTSQGQPNRHIIVREMILLALAVMNKGLKSFQELFDDTSLKQGSPYVPLIANLEEFFKTQPAFSQLGQTLFDLLRAPMLASPDSLEGQLEYIKKHWVMFLPPGLFQRMLLIIDILKEESRLRGFGPGFSDVLQFGRRAAMDLDLPYLEPARFAEDRDWMSNVVLLAKSVYVWLDQLSKRYQRPIRRLDEIPDEELDRLARWGITGLWLIGVWERSPASQEIKQRMGNPEAGASAYSVDDYCVALDLGGESACDNLRQRAWRHGIRLASDMVPNHTGIYSRWIIEHPDWFIHLDYPPYPNYRFSGPDLSKDSRVSLFIEDGYWDRRDAAVVFKRVDNQTGSVKYIYHGNDGTHMPWNDTAQLNYLIPEVREALIQTILGVARQFPIIRFDAAMTLSKRHYQRLWFPKPGDGGAVPSRAEYGMSRAEFDAFMPDEFWRQVVDRIKHEAPDTLLLAEAFWLMEGYFVRSLGMHRVYNTAFMNMLKMQENSKYRSTVKNVLEFSPEVLKRFVNFMNNPDEGTAVEQFGKGDKYFGVAVMMVTMPGLPMFGHGQIEGLAERYGMEYRRAYWDEQVDQEMVRRHEVEVFPLMRKRYLFSGVEEFTFYDFHTAEGYVNEDVFAYSNRAGAERAIILYNNAYSSTSGWINRSTPINMGKPEEGPFIRKTLAQALALRTEERYFYVFRDHRDGLEYLRQGCLISQQGLFVQLQGYQYRAFIDFREIEDKDGTWARLAGRLGGKGVPNMEEAYREAILSPLMEGFGAVINPELLKTLVTSVADESVVGPARSRVSAAFSMFFDRLEQWLAHPFDRDKVLHAVLVPLEVVQRFESYLNAAKLHSSLADFLLRQIPATVQAKPAKTDDILLANQHCFAVRFWRIPFTWALVRPIAMVGGALEDESQTALYLDEWRLSRVIVQTFNQMDSDWWSAVRDGHLIKILLCYRSLLVLSTKPERLAGLGQMFNDPAVGEYLFINQHKGILWLNKEQMEKLMYWLFFVFVVCIIAGPEGKDKQAVGQISAGFDYVQKILSAAETSGYRVETLLRLLAD